MASTSFSATCSHLTAEAEAETAERPEQAAVKRASGSARRYQIIFRRQDRRHREHLSRQRMETLDEEVTARRCRFHRTRQRGEANRSFSGGSSHAHAPRRRHPVRIRSSNPVLAFLRSTQSDTTATWGQILDKLDELGLAENTIVIYSSDNGAEEFSSPDGSMTSPEGQNNATLEGRFRVPLVVRWPGVIDPGTQIDEIISHMDWFPTIAAALGDVDIRRKSRAGCTARQNSASRFTSTATTSCRT